MLGPACHTHTHASSLCGGHTHRSRQGTHTLVPSVALGTDRAFSACVRVCVLCTRCCAVCGLAVAQRERLLFIFLCRACPAYVWWCVLYGRMRSRSAHKHTHITHMMGAREQDRQSAIKHIFCVGALFSSSPYIRFAVFIGAISLHHSRALACYIII